MKKLSGIKVNGFVFYVNPSSHTAKVGARGKAIPLIDVFRSVSKGEARKLRKTLHGAGFLGLAAVK